MTNINTPTELIQVHSYKGALYVKATELHAFLQIQVDPLEWVDEFLDYLEAKQYEDYTNVYKLTKADRQRANNIGLGKPPVTSASTTDKRELIDKYISLETVRHILGELTHRHNLKDAKELQRYLKDYEMAFKIEILVQVQSLLHHTDKQTEKNGYLAILILVMEALRQYPISKRAFKSFDEFAISKLEAKEVLQDLQSVKYQNTGKRFNSKDEYYITLAKLKTSVAWHEQKKLVKVLREVDNYVMKAYEFLNKQK